MFIDVRRLYKLISDAYSTVIAMDESFYGLTLTDVHPDWSHITLKLPALEGGKIDDDGDHIEIRLWRNRIEIVLVDEDDDEKYIAVVKSKNNGIMSNKAINKAYDIASRFLFENYTAATGKSAIGCSRFERISKNTDKEIDEDKMIHTIKVITQKTDEGAGLRHRVTGTATDMDCALMMRDHSIKVFGALTKTVYLIHEFGTDDMIRLEFLPDKIIKYQKFGDDEWVGQSIPQTPQSVKDALNEFICHINTPASGVFKEDGE